MEKKWYLGDLKFDYNGKRKVFLTDFSWDCDWYWSGGYVGNSQFHCHFDGCFLDVPDHRGHPLGDFPPSKLTNGCAVWESLEKFLDNPQYTEREWWRIKDLFKQFYALRASAEVFRHGGHCTSDARNPAETVPDMEKAINKHIETVIIPEIRKALNKEIPANAGT